MSESRPGRKASNHPAKRAPSVIASALKDVKQEANSKTNATKVVDWVQKNASVHQIALAQLLDEFLTLPHIDYEDRDMLARVNYRLGMVEALESFDVDGEKVQPRYEAALDAFQKAVNIRKDLIGRNRNAHRILKQTQTHTHAHTRTHTYTHTHTRTCARVRTGTHTTQTCTHTHKHTHAHARARARTHTHTHTHTHHI